jgi:hypothetical protein
MRTRLQLKIPTAFAASMFLAHSLIVAALWRFSVTNIELGVLWEHMRLTDLPISVFLDSFCSGFMNVFPRSNYPTPEAVFHLILGGLQFLIWGWLLGLIARRLLQRRCPAREV